MTIDTADSQDLWGHLTVASLGLSPAWHATPEDVASKCATTMEEKGFDAAPIVGDSRTLQSVQLDKLRSLPRRSLVSEAMKPVDVRQIVTPATPLSEVISRLPEYDTVFALDSLGGVGVITMADLARPPFAAAMFSSITQLEQRLNQFLQLFDDAKVLARGALSAKALKRVEQLVDERKRRHRDLSFVQSLTLEDRFDVVSAYAELWAQLVDSKRDLNELRKNCQRIRNTLAHGGTVLDIDSNVRETLEHFTRLDTLSRCVAERISDPRWTQFAFAEVHLNSGECLAGPSALPQLQRQPLWVITAYNPNARPEAKEVNEARQAELLRRLRDDGLKFQEGWGGRGTHREASAVVRGIDRHKAVQIAQEFGQLGVFELTSTTQEVVQCSDRKSVRTIPRVRTRKR